MLGSRSVAGIVLRAAATILLAGLVLVWVRGAPPSTDLGVGAGELQPCPEGPGCVSSLEADEAARVPPLQCDARLADVITVLAGMPSTRVESHLGTYVHLTVRTSPLRVVEDVELLADPVRDTIQVRTVGRHGWTDERGRVEALRAHLEAAGLCR